MNATFSPKQASLVGEHFEDWNSYYYDGGVLEPGNLEGCDMTLEDAMIEQAKAAKFSWDGNTLTFVPGSSLLSDICHRLEMDALDTYMDNGTRRAARGALAKLEGWNTF